MNKHDECQANAMECQRMADIAKDPLDKALWTGMTGHWRYLSPVQTVPPQSVCSSIESCHVRNCSICLVADDALPPAALLEVRLPDGARMHRARLAGPRSADIPVPVLRACGNDRNQVQVARWSPVALGRVPLNIIFDVRKSLSF